jgi:plasmid maintenance system antidote protein VapI
VIRTNIKLGYKKMQQQLIPARAFPPGRILQKELETRGWSNANLEIINPHLPQLIAEIIQGRQIITPNIAEELSQAFGTSAQLWINLENNYRLYITKKSVK